MLERKDNIGDTSTTTGTGTLSLAAVAQTGARIFAGNVTSGATVRYDIRLADDSEWEIGEGVFTDGAPDTLTRVTVYASSNAGSLVNFSAGTKNVSLVFTVADIATLADGIAPPNLLKNGNFINNSTNGYGSTPDDWTNSSANPVQGGIPALTKQNLIDMLGVADGDIEGLWPLNEASGNALDLSSNAYNLTDNNTVGVSSDGLMASARDFESGNSEYFTIADASCANLEIAGSKTYIAFIKPESIITDIIMAKGSGAVGVNLYINTGTGVVTFNVAGLTTNTNVTSDVSLQIGKWYMIVGIYDSANSKLKIWINGIKKEVTASDSGTDTNGAFNIGRNTDGSYFDGLIQNACVLSVALTDNQVKKLFAETMYKGQKVRRATTDAYLYQDLPMNVVAELRGKTISMAADGYCESTNHGIYITTNGTGGTTTKDNPASANVWERLFVSVTVPSDATSIRYGFLAETTDGNSWFKESTGYKGSVSLPYDHSKDDWSRFPRLLRMDIPAVISGYQFEEFKPHLFTSTLTGFSAVTDSGMVFIVDGKKCLMKPTSANSDLVGTSNATTFTFTIPVVSSSTRRFGLGGAMFFTQDNGVNGSTVGQIRGNGLSLTSFELFKSFYAGAWTGSGTKGVYMGWIIYEID